MRRAGIPQVIRMKITGHKTDSIERRYNIVDAEDLAKALELLERRPTIPEFSGFGNSAKQDDTADL
jgi:hypothetical protein